MTKDEALKLALEKIVYLLQHCEWYDTEQAVTTIREILAQPPLPEQEPAAWLTEERYAQLHTAQRPWVNLTVDELIDLEHKHLSHENLVRAIEAKLKEKNI